jgi:hypothetical protein
MNQERVMRLKITFRHGGEQKTVNWTGFPYYEGFPDTGFGFRISAYEDYENQAGRHFSIWIPIEDLVTMEIKPA